MIDPYRMVLVNIVLLLALLLGITVYKFIFPRKKLNLFLLLILFSLLPTVSILRKGVYESGDFNLHIYRAMSFYKAVQDGNIIPSWAGDLNGTYGYQLFLFLNPLPYYIISFFHFLGLTFILSMKFFLAFSFILSGITFYLWAKNEFKNKLAAFTGSIFYLYAPYHLLDLHFRVAIGEILFFAVLPLFMYNISKFLSQKKLSYIPFIGLSFALLVLSHQGLATLSLFLIMPYLIYKFIYLRTRGKKLLDMEKLFIFLEITLGIIIGLLICSFTLLPQIIFSKFTYSYLLTRQPVVFPQINWLIFSEWQHGFLFQGPKGELSFVLGYTQLLIIIVLFYMFVKKRALDKRLRKYNFTFWIFAFILILFLITKYSVLLWKYLPILNLNQFSTRFLLPMAFIASAISSIFVNYFEKKKMIIAALILLTVLSTILNWGNRRMITDINDKWLLNNLPKSSYEGEALGGMGQPIWIPNNGKTFVLVPPKSHAEIIKGEGKINLITRKTQYHEILTSSKTLLTVKDNTWFFPGWKAYVDNREIPINYATKNYPGIIKINVPIGMHDVVIKYDDLLPIKISKYLSVATLLFIFLFYFSGLVNHKRLK